MPLYQFNASLWTIYVTTLSYLKVLKVTSFQVRSPCDDLAVGVCLDELDLNYFDDLCT